MITFFRFLLLIFMVCFSSFFFAILAYTIRLALQGEWGGMDAALLLDTWQWSGIGVCVLVLLTGSSFGDGIARLFLPLRRMSLREEKIIGPPLQTIRKLYRQKYNRDLRTQVLVIDVPDITALSLGRNTVAVSSGLLKVASEDEITATIAHEIGHLHHRDSFFSLALITARIPTVMLNNLLRFWESDNKPMNIAMPSQAQDAATITQIAIIIGLIFTFFYFILAWAASFIVLWLFRVLEKIVEWPIEYRADRFACDLGLGSGLISLFERLDIQDIRNNYGFLSAYVWSHPPTALRIDKIERQFMGGEQAV